MSTQDKEPAISRVVITIEPDGLDPDLIANAARLARAYDAELVGLFVKVQDYLNLAELPFTRSVVASTGEIRPLNKARMEKALDAMAARAKKGLSEQAAQQKLKWSFQTLVGHAEDIVSAHTTSTDIVSLSGVAAHTMRKTATGTSRPAMVITRRGLEGRRPVMVVYEGQTATLAAGRRIATSLGVGLSVMIGADSTEACAGLCKNAQNWLQRHQMNADLYICDQDTDLMAQLALYHPGLVVLSHHGRHGSDMRARLERYEPDIPVLLVDGAVSEEAL
jgi:hypothetical protein